MICSRCWEDHITVEIYERRSEDGMLVEQRVCRVIEADGCQDPRWLLAARQAFAPPSAVGPRSKGSRSP